MVYSKYQETIELNDQLLSLYAAYAREESTELVLSAFNLLHTITQQEIWKVIGKLCLPRSMAEDMDQDAFMKLFDIFRYKLFDPRRCPVFITFWRRSISNHLLSKYYQRQSSAQLVVDVEDRRSAVGEDEVVVRDIRRKFVHDFNSWPERYSKRIPFAIAILLERVLIPREERTPQDSIATRFGVTQEYVSRWETWVRNKVKRRWG